MSRISGSKGDQPYEVQLAADYQWHPSGLILGQYNSISLLTNLINTNYGTESTLNKFADDFKLVGVAGAGDPSQRDLHRLEKWPDGELVKVNQGKRKVLPPGQSNSLQQHRLGQLAVKQLCRKRPAKFSGRQSGQMRGSQDNCFYGLSI